MVKTGRRTGDAVIYDVARQFKDALRRRDSAFTPGRAIWTAAAFGELVRDFVSVPDTSGGNFESKLMHQLANVGDDARQLMSELLALHLLPSSAIGAQKKAERIDAALRMMDDPVPLPNDIRECLRHGVMNTGAYYNTGRPAHLRFLIRVGAHLTSMPPGTTPDPFDDPWVFRDTIDAVPIEGAATQRHALLHLFFPDTFEAIVSDDHLARIIATFGEQADTITGDQDRDLLAIRAALEPSHGTDFDFYSARLKPRWDQGTDPWAELITWAERLYRIGDLQSERDHKLHAVESFGELRVALDADREGWLDVLTQYQERGHDKLLDARTASSFTTWAGGNPAVARRAILDLIDESELLATRVQHFAETIQSAVRTPPSRTAQAAYLLMGSDPTGCPPFQPHAFTKFLALVGATSRKAEGDRYLQAIQICDDMSAELAERAGVVLRDRLDAHSIIWLMTTIDSTSQVIEQWSDEERTAFFRWRDGFTSAGAEPDSTEETAATAEGLTDSGGGSTDVMGQAALNTHLPVSYLRQLRDLLDDKGQLVLYGPPGTGKTFVAMELARAVAGGDTAAVSLVQFHPSTTYEDFFEGIRPRTDDDGTLRYEVVPGPLARIAAQAASNPSTTYVMVIDELNRANLPKVLGELLFLFEYRDREMFTLYRPDQPFALPRNLRFISTMNTVDRSVALVDAAMRRRFHFVPFYPDSEHVSAVLGSICSDDEAWVAELVEQVNHELVQKLGSRDHQLGASHFIKCDRTETGVEQVWRFTIEPMIEDQLFGQDHRMREFRWKAVKRRFVDGTGISPDVDADGDVDEP